MNIKTNEILLLNKIKMEGDKNSNVATLEPIADEASAEKGMRALMFQGMKNLMSNPNLAIESGLADEIEPKQTGENAEGYIAPYKSNLAFGHKVDLAKNGAKILAGLAVAGAVTTGVTSCKPFEEGDTIVTQQVSIDFTEFFQIMQQFLATLSAKLDKLDDTNKLLQDMQQTLLEILASNKTQEQKFDEIFTHFIIMEANQEIIRQQLVVNGMKQDEANKFLQDLINAVNNHTMTAQEAWQQIIDRLDLTNSILNNIYNTIKESLAQLIAQGAEANEIATGILNNTAATNNKLDELNGKVTGVASELVNIRLSNETIGANIQASIAQGVVNITDNVTSNIAALAQAVHMDIDDFKATMVRMGITEMQLQKMSVYELLKAIDKNTNEIKNLQNIVNDLLYEYQQGKLTAEQFAQKVIDAMTQMNATLADISATLKDVNANINALRKDMKTQTKKIINNQDKSYNMLNQLVNNTNGLGEQLTAIQTSLETFATRVENAINESTISQNANVASCMAELAGAVKMSVEDLKALLVQMHISEQQLQTMTVAQLLRAINANTNEVKSLKASVNNFLEEYKAGRLTAEQFAQKILDALNLIDAKLGTLIAELSGARAELMDKLNEIMDVMNSNASYLGAKIDDSKDFIGNKLDVMIDGQQTIVTTINEAVKEGVLSVNDNVNANFDKIANVIGMSTSDLKSLLVQMHISDQQLQTMRVNALLTAINANTNEVKNLKASFDNFVKQYEAGQITAKEFAEKIIGLLGEISAKLDGISAQITQFYNDLMAALKDANKTLVKIDNKTKITNSYLSELNNKIQVAIDAQNDYKQDFADLKQLAKDNNTYQSEILAELKSHPDKYKDMLDRLGISVNQAINMSAAQFTAKIDEAMANYDKTEGKQTQLLVNIYNELKNHQGGTFDDTNIINAINALKAALNGDVTTVNAKLQAILDALNEISAKLDGISSQITQLYNDVISLLKDANTTLTELKGGQTITNSYLNKLNKNVEDLKAAQKDYKQDFADLKALAKDQITYENEILNELKSHPDKYKDMLSKLGISVNQAINMSASQFSAKIDEAMANYDKTEGKQTQLLTDIYNELKNHQGGTIDDTKIVNAINALKASMNSDIATVNAKLQAILDALQGISGQLDDLINEVKALSSTVRQMNTYLTNFNTYWTQALGSLGDYANDLAEIKTLLKAGNTNTAAIKAKLDEIKADLEAMKASQARAEAFLSGIKTNSQIIINKLDQFKDIDYDKIEQAMKNVSDTDYQRYKELLEKLAIDPAKFDSIEALIQAIKNSVEDIQKDTKYGKKIYDILKDVDWTNPANIAKLDQIINILNNLKVNCQCSCNGGNPDEGGHNVDDLDDLING